MHARLATAKDMAVRFARRGLAIYNAEQCDMILTWRWARSFFSAGKWLKHKRLTNPAEHSSSTMVSMTLPASVSPEFGLQLLFFDLYQRFWA